MEGFGALLGKVNKIPCRGTPRKVLADRYRVVWQLVEGCGLKRTRGGESARGRVKVNWKVIIAPNRIVGYVVVHELVHLRHHNDGPEFWRGVGRVIPDYLECKEWLKVNGRGLKL